MLEFVTTMDFVFLIDEGMMRFPIKTTLPRIGSWITCLMFV